MPFGFLALLAAFGTLANSLRSNSASVLIRTLLRCSARPNGGGYHTARPLRELRPGCSFAALTSRGLGLPHSSRLTSLKGTARRATTTDPLTPHFSSWATTRVAPTPSPLAKARHAVPLRPLPLAKARHAVPLRPLASQRHGTPCPYALSPHKGTARRTPTPSPLAKARHAVPLRPHPSQRHGTPCPYDLTPHSYDLTPHPSLLRPPQSARKPDQRHRQTGYLQGVGADEIAGMCLGSCQVFPERLVLCGQMPCYGVNLCIQCQTGLFHQGVLSACGSGKRLCTLAGNASARDARFSHASSNTAPSKSHRLAASMARLAG